MTLNQAACLAVIRFEYRVVIGGLGVWADDLEPSRNL